MTLQRLPFAISHYLCPADMNLLEFLDAACKCGFSSVGLTLRALDETTTPRLVRELKVRGLGVSSVNSAGFFLIEDGDARRRQDMRNTSLLEATAELGAHALNVIVGAQTEKPLHEARRRAAEHFAQFADQAKSMNVSLAVEPLNPLNVRTKSCFNTIAQMERVLKGMEGVSLNADLFHLWWDPDLERLLNGESIDIGLLQICDVSTDPTNGLPRRIPLGEGFMDWRCVVGAVRRQFPNAPIELELFADQLPGRNVKEILENGAILLSHDSRNSEESIAH